MYKIHLCVGFFTSPLNRSGAYFYTGTKMDIELETYVDQIMDSQRYRSGIFSNLMERYARAVAYYRAPVDTRGIPAVTEE
jgi:hypothetical protein